MYFAVNDKKRGGFWAADQEGDQVKPIRRLTNFICWVEEEKRIDGARYIKLKGQLEPKSDLLGFWMPYSEFRAGSGLRQQISQHWGVKPVIMHGVRVFEVIDVILSYSKIRLQKLLTEEADDFLDTLPWDPADFQFNKQ